MSQSFYIQVALVSKDKHLALNYHRVLDASSKYLLVEHFEDVSRMAIKAELFSHINTFIFDLETVQLDELAKLRTIFETKRILAIDSGPASIVQALSVGIDGYLSKRDDYRRLLDFIWKVNEGEKTLDQESMNHLFDNFRKELNTDLTARERQVLEELGLSKSYDQIADKLAISKATVKTHIEHIYDKLDARDKFEAIEKARTKRLI